ncbi:MAG: HupE/UreJ family protein [Pseudorhodoplanes sp.]|jgi:urease accessory protein|nr:HupE/UreJ family protein [Pseudorhodoplanes sp.]
MRLRRAAFATILAASGTPAHAHTVIEGVSGFPGGLLHPLLVPAHALLLLTLGLLAGQQASARRRIILPLFSAALITAIALIAAAVALDTRNALLWLCAVNGVLVALAWPLPPLLPAALIVAGAVALMLDSVPALLSVRDTLMALSGTAFGALAVFTLVVALSARANQPWQMTGRRILGSWAAAGAILVLALRLAK